MSSVKNSVVSSFFSNVSVATINIQVAATDIWFFGIYCEFLVEATVQNFMLLFVTETD